MEIAIKDLQELKLSPSLICLLKAIHNKNNEYLSELNKVSDIFIMAKFLERNMILKIIDDKIDYNSFEIRKLSIIDYLNDTEYTVDDVVEVINYFKQKTGKLRVSNKSVSNRKFISARLKEYSVQDLKDVIDLKYSHWVNDPKMRQYLRIETLMNETKFQGYIGELETNDIKDFSDDI